MLIWKTPLFVLLKCQKHKNFSPLKVSEQFLEQHNIQKKMGNQFSFLESEVGMFVASMEADLESMQVEKSIYFSCNTKTVQWSRKSVKRETIFAT